MGIRRVLLATLAVALLAIPATAYGQSGPVVFSGTVSWSPAAPAGNNVQILVRVVEGDGKSRAPYTGVIESRGALPPPYQFSLNVPASWFRANQTYSVQVFVADGDAIRFSGSIPVTSAGARNLNITALPTSGSLSKTSGGLLLLIGLSLATIAAGLFVWRQLRLRAPARQLA